MTSQFNSTTDPLSLTLYFWHLFISGTHNNSMYLYMLSWCSWYTLVEVRGQYHMSSSMLFTLCKTVSHWTWSWPIQLNGCQPQEAGAGDLRWSLKLVLEAPFNQPEMKGILVLRNSGKQEVMPREGYVSKGDRSRVSVVCVCWDLAGFSTETQE